MLAEALHKDTLFKVTLTVSSCLIVSASSKRREEGGRGGGGRREGRGVNFTISLGSSVVFKSARDIKQRGHADE